MRVETEGLLDYQGWVGIISIVWWNLRPVIFGVEPPKSALSEEGSRKNIWMADLSSFAAIMSLKWDMSERGILIGKNTCSCKPKKVPICGTTCIWIVYFLKRGALGVNFGPESVARVENALMNSNRPLSEAPSALVSIARRQSASKHVLPCLRLFVMCCLFIFISLSFSFFLLSLSLSQFLVFFLFSLSLSLSLSFSLSLYLSLSLSLFSLFFLSFSLSLSLSLSLFVSVSLLLSVYVSGFLCFNAACCARTVRLKRWHTSECCRGSHGDVDDALTRWSLKEPRPSILFCHVKSPGIKTSKESVFGMVVVVFGPSKDIGICNHHIVVFVRGTKNHHAWSMRLAEPESQGASVRLISLFKQGTQVPNQK